MKSFIVFALLVAAAAAAPAGVSGPEAAAEVIQNELNNIGVEGFSYKSQTSNGIAQEAQGQLKNVGSENEALEVRGSFSYIGTDGVTYAVTYIADENGFHPSGAHLPVGPQA